MASHSKGKLRFRYPLRNELPQQADGVEGLEGFGEEDAVFADEFAVEVNLAAAVVGVSALVAKSAARILQLMIQTIEAIVDEHGAVRLLEPLHLDRRHRALVTILADEPSEAHETAILSEPALAQDWNRTEEDAAWSHLQQAQ